MAQRDFNLPQRGERFGRLILFGAGKPALEQRFGATGIAIGHSKIASPKQGAEMKSPTIASLFRLGQWFDDPKGFTD
jgi:hypothetical protein